MKIILLPVLNPRWWITHLTQLYFGFKDTVRLMCMSIIVLWEIFPVITVLEYLAVVQEYFPKNESISIHSIYRFWVILQTWIMWTVHCYQDSTIINYFEKPGLSLKLNSQRGKHTLIYWYQKHYEASVVYTFTHIKIEDCDFSYGFIVIEPTKTIFKILVMGTFTQIVHYVHIRQNSPAL